MIILPPKETVKFLFRLSTVAVEWKLFAEVMRKEGCESGASS